ncbi:hypothetical protein H4R24_001341 [Coemansia sp. RSA 988]|nr:hypothetical protein H4R24_001341 [Coemansia sp. RSA 988]
MTKAFAQVASLYMLPGRANGAALGIIQDFSRLQLQYLLTNPPQQAMGDIFDRIIDIEGEYENSGYAEGLADGKRIGVVEGRELGCEHGFDIGKDLGFYRGWAQEWLRVAAAHPELVSERARKKLLAIQEAVNAVPSANSEGAHFAERIKDIQLKFKTVSAMLGVGASAELPTNSLSY